MVPFFGPEDRDSYSNMPATDHKYIVLGARLARVERRDTLAEATVLTDKIALTLYMEREGNMKFRVRIAWVVGVTVLAWHTVSLVQAQTVTVPDLPPVVPAEAATSAPTTPASLSPIAAPVIAAEPPRWYWLKWWPQPRPHPRLWPHRGAGHSRRASPGGASRGGDISPDPTPVSDTHRRAVPVIAAEPPAVVPAEAVTPASTTPDSLSSTEETVIFSEINDAVPGKYFDTATTAPDPLNPNKLIIGFNTGFDAASWTNNTFAASTAVFHRAVAMDTISFLIEAPAGFYIAKISYTQSGKGVRARTGMAAGSVNWVVDYVAEDIGRFGENSTLSRTIDLTGQHKTIIPVSITGSVFAFATPQLGAASIQVTSAEVLVELLPLP